MVEKIIFADQTTKIINYIASPEGIADVGFGPGIGGSAGIGQTYTLPLFNIWK